MDPKFVQVRAATGLQRPGGEHGCKPVEIIPGLWNGSYNDVNSLEKLSASAPPVTLVINTAAPGCTPVEYGEGISSLLIEGLNDDPDAKKKVDAMPEGPEKVSALAALPAFKASELAGDAKKDFARVNAAIDAARASGGAALVHCQASLSRSVVFALAYIMKEKRCTAAEAVAIMKPKWGATWPNDSFVNQLLEYEKEVAK